jgi:hypothetical protein
MVDGVSANVGVQPTAGLGPRGRRGGTGLQRPGRDQTASSRSTRLQEFRIQSSSYAPEFGRCWRSNLHRHALRDQPVPWLGLRVLQGRRARCGGLLRRAAAVAGSRRNASTTSAESSVDRSCGTARSCSSLYEGLRWLSPRSVVTEVPSLASRLAAPTALRPIFAAFPLPNGVTPPTVLARVSASYSIRPARRRQRPRGPFVRAGADGVRPLQLRPVRRVEPAGSFAIAVPTRSATCNNGCRR